MQIAGSGGIARWQGGSLYKQKDAKHFVYDACRTIDKYIAFNKIPNLCCTVEQDSVSSAFKYWIDLFCSRCLNNVYPLFVM